MKNKNLSITLLVALFLFLGVGNVNAAPPLATIQKVKDQVESVRYQLPVEISYGISLTQLSYDSKTYTVIYRYHYSIPVSKPTPEAIKESKLSIIHMLKINPNSEDMQFLKNGITFHYNYYSTDGTFLYAVKITPADIK